MRSEIHRAFLHGYRAKLLSRPILFGWLIASAFLTLTGPFGTYEGFPIGQRALYWLIAVAMSLVIGIGVETGINLGWPDLGPWTGTLVVSSVFTALFTPPLYLFTLAMADDTAVVLSPLFVALVVFIVPVVHRALDQLVYRRSGPPATEATENQPPEPARLLRRLDMGEATKIWRLTVRDHYVDVFTDAGKHSLLMRFSDAMDELEGIAGMQVHRSHWVATEAVRAVEREGGRMFVRLYDGETVPVSRAYQKQVAHLVSQAPVRDAELAENG
ncbi:MAG: LytTR family DNA-binding domain-containing protein [Pseudomonadota bacterium]